jgi:hypothetical protein
MPLTLLHTLEGKSLEIMPLRLSTACGEILYYVAVFKVRISYSWFKLRLFDCTKQGRCSNQFVIY